MAIKRFFATADTSIVNCYRGDLTSSAELSNMGAADSLQVFSAWNQNGFETSSLENGISRILIKFNISDISGDSEIPPNAQVYLKLFNVAHDETLPKNFTLSIHPLTKSWTEGRGLDMDDYWDLGNANWQYASDGNAWENDGGDYSSVTEFTQSFVNGTEDLEVEISTLYASWKSGSLSNNGVIVKFHSSMEYSTESFYKKMFSARGTEYFFSRPCLEVRWDDSLFDDRNNAYFSSALVPGSENINKLILFNRARGRLVDVPVVETTGNLYVRYFSGNITGIPVTFSTASWYKTGIYTTSFYTTHTGSLIDAWYNHDNSSILFTGTINSSLGRLKDVSIDYFDWNDEFVLSMPNLKKVYKTSDNPRLDVFIRKADWQANVYVVATQEQETEFVKNAYFRVKRPIDDRTVIEFATGSLKYTKLSYDKDGNYFNFNMNLLEPGFEYQFDFMFDIDGKLMLQPHKFKFRVE